MTNGAATGGGRKRSRFALDPAATSGKSTLGFGRLSLVQDAGGIVENFNLLFTDGVGDLLLLGDSRGGQ